MAAALPKAWTAIVLAAIAGSVDAIGYACLAKTLVSHLSGDTATMAIHTAHHAFGEALHRLLPIPGFLAGVFVGRVLSDVARDARIRRRLSVVLALEVALVLAFAALLRGAPTAALLAIAAAMGVQSAALRHAAGHDLRTTFVTGMLVTFVDEAVDAWLRRDAKRKPFAFLHGGVWLAFAIGAWLGAIGWLTLGRPSIAVVVAALLVVVARDLAVPIAPEA